MHLEFPRGRRDGLALRELSPVFDKMYSKRGRHSIPPERLLKATLLMALHSVRSEQLAMRGCILGWGRNPGDGWPAPRPMASFLPFCATSGYRRLRRSAASDGRNQPAPDRRGQGIVRAPMRGELRLSWREQVSTASMPRRHPSCAVPGWEAP